MKIILALFLLTLLNFDNLFSQVNDSIIYWSPNYHLEWSDFQSEKYDSLQVKSDISAKAYSATGIEYSSDYYQNQVPTFVVYNYFNRKRSWSIKEFKSNNLLAHEQLHFDISQLYVRKIRAKIFELNSVKIMDIKRYTSAIDKLMDESNKLQDRYDSETAHGVISDIQILWKKKIDKELDSLKSFENIEKK